MSKDADKLMLEKALNQREVSERKQPGYGYKQDGTWLAPRLQGPRQA